MIERIVNANSSGDDNLPEEQELENTLRPRDFTGYIGQERIKQNLRLAIAAANAS